MRRALRGLLRGATFRQLASRATGKRTMDGPPPGWKQRANAAGAGPSRSALSTVGWVSALQTQLKVTVMHGKSAYRVADGLHPYQKEAVEFILSRGGRGLLGHEMGLGKTPMALAIVAHFMAEAPVLVVAPPVLLEQWASEIMTWLPDTTREEIQIIKNGKELPKPEARFVLVSYSILSGQRKGGLQSNEQLRLTAASTPYRVIVCDECHALKSMDASRTQTLVPMIQKAERAVLMSGTPMANSCAAEVYPLLKALGGTPSALPSLLHWNQRFCAGKKAFGYGCAYAVARSRRHMP